MAYLTNGSMSYERRVKTGDFEHKLAAVTINYALDEGDDADKLLALARTLVVQHVHAALSPPPAVNPTPLQPPSPAVVQPKIETDDERLKRIWGYEEPNRGFMVPESFTKPDEELLPRTTLKEAMETEIVTPVTNLKAAKRAAKKRGENPTPTPSVEEVIVPPTSVLVSEPVSDVIVATELILGMENAVADFTAVAPAATDAELAQALSRVNAKLKDRPRIQALIGEFVQSGQHYYMIPAVRRAEFITRLEALV